MGFHAFFKEWYKPRPLEQLEHLRDISRRQLGPYTIQGNKVPLLFTVELWRAIKIWNNFKVFGLPFAGGWAEQPKHIVKIITMVESASNQEEEEKRKKPTGSSPKMRPTIQ